MNDITGFNILLDLHGCPEDKLDDIVILKKTLSKIAIDSGFKVVGEKFHQFKPVGVTGIVLLSTSHISIHTWPEVNFVAVDIYSCAGKKAAKKAVEFLIDFFKPKKYEIKEIERYR